MFVVGGVLLSHILPGAVPSALVGLASGFGMGPGVSQPLSPPTRRVRAVFVYFCLACVVCLILHSEQRVNHVLCFVFCFWQLHCVFVVWLLVPVTSDGYPPSSSGLSTPSSVGNRRNLILKQASRLDAFSGYPSRT